MRPIVFRTLRREYRLHAPPEIRQQLLFMETTPTISGVELEIVDIEARLRDGFVVATLPGGRLIEGSANNLLSALHQLVMQDLIDTEPGAPFVHGATVVVDDRRLLMVAQKGSGKSTLALHLAMQGHQVEGDEHLVIREREVVARPRTLRVKPGTLSLVAGLPPSVWDAPFIANWDDSPIRAVSPAIGGQDWVIRSGRLSGIVFLVANHGGRSAARRIAAEDAFRRLMRNVLLPSAGVAMAAGRLRQLAATTPAYRLLLGNLDVAEWHLRSIAGLLT
ncbi:MAG: hypothetical protein JWQ89_2716 [Devosia sp.]|uniref:hypothetical protein n=1 Tax=Devosia sp. TaxID=1871048 RepID=UPI002636C343|nr:hypothetical protein [Devosia sp.]MDB5540989.1 hypothetical protein [Devosia sp.]